MVLCAQSLASLEGDHAGQTGCILFASTDVLGRLGGDEFGGLLVRCGGEAAAIGFVARLEEEMARRPWPFDSTVGITCAYQSLKHSPSPSEALHAADLAMLAKKRDR